VVVDDLHLQVDDGIVIHLRFDVEDHLLFRGESVWLEIKKRSSRRQDANERCESELFRPSRVDFTIGCTKIQSDFDNK
jgi:hypothetical protein